jgi:hypothetical protein
MLPDVMLPVPASLASLLAVFGPLFTAPSFRNLVRCQAINGIHRTRQLCAACPAGYPRRHCVQGGAIHEPSGSTPRKPTLVVTQAVAGPSARLSTPNLAPASHRRERLVPRVGPAPARAGHQPPSASPPRGRPVPGLPRPGGRTAPRTRRLCSPGPAHPRPSTGSPARTRTRQSRRHTPRRAAAADQPTGNRYCPCSTSVLSVTEAGHVLPGPRFGVERGEHSDGYHDRFLAAAARRRRRAVRSMPGRAGRLLAWLAEADAGDGDLGE